LKCDVFNSVNSGSLLQAGTEDGYINIFTVTDEKLMYDKILDKQEGKCGTSSGFHPLSDL